MRLTWQGKQIVQWLAVAVLAFLVFSFFQHEKNQILGDIQDKLRGLQNFCVKVRKTGEKINNEPRKVYSPLVIKNGYSFPRSLCGYSDASIDWLLAKPHNCNRTADRVWVNGEWMTSKQMKYDLSLPTQNGENAIKCVIYCVEDSFPCASQKCLIPLFVRQNTTDPKVVSRILESNEFDILKQKMNFKFILDCGAGIGVTSVLFSVMYPGATIISAEPSRDRFSMLQMNARYFPRITPVKVAISPKVERMMVSSNTSGYRETTKKYTNLGNTATVQALSIDFISKLFSIPGFEFVKIDIGGSERSLLGKAGGKASAWIKEAKLILVSFNEKKVKGSKHNAASALSSHADWVYHGWWVKYRIYKAKKFTAG